MFNKDDGSTCYIINDDVQSHYLFHLSSEGSFLLQGVRQCDHENTW